MLAEAGWGVIFAEDDPQTGAISDALAPLLGLRREEAGGEPHYRANKQLGDEERPNVRFRKQTCVARSFAAASVAAAPGTAERAVARTLADLPANLTEADKPYLESHRAVVGQAVAARLAARRRTRQAIASESSVT